MKRIKKIIFLILILCVGLTLVSCKDKKVDNPKNISILFTSDVHTGYNDNITYSGLKAYQKERINEGYETILIDTGDFVQGDLICSITQGLFNVDLLNKMGYSAFTLGNHEFDYGMDALKDMIDLFKGDVLCANIKYTGSKENKIKDVKPYTIIDIDNIKIAIVGATTPESLSDGNPNLFKEDGNIAYSFDGLIENVQASIDNAKKDGASYVILATHLGYDDIYSPSSSKDLVASISGADAIIDGHAHLSIEPTLVKTKDNKEIPLMCLGTKMSSFGEIIISDGKLSTQVIKEYAKKDEELASYIEEREKLFEAETSKVVARSNISLSIYDSDGIRMTRSRETQIGNLCADALKYESGAEIAFMNGGGVRDSINAGDITYADIFKVNPFGDEVVKVKLKGEYILDYLEYAAKNTKSVYSDGGKAAGENGGFAIVSGLKYTIDTSITSTCISDESGNFIRVDGQRRIKDVYVLENGEYKPLDSTKMYEVAMSDFMLAGGDGMIMLKNGILDSSYGAVHEVFINYIAYTLKGDLSQYENIEGRIIIE